MMNTLPERRTTLHFGQRLRTDDVTLILFLLLPIAATKTPIIPASFPSEQTPSRGYGSVRIIGSASVTATVCSKCAVMDPSAETTVH